MIDRYDVYMIQMIHIICVFDKCMIYNLYT